MPSLSVHNSCLLDDLVELVSIYSGRGGYIFLGVSDEDRSLIGNGLKGRLKPKVRLKAFKLSLEPTLLEKLRRKTGKVLSISNLDEVLKESDISLPENRDILWVLNFYREIFLNHQILALIWTKPETLKEIPLRARDLWDGRLGSFLFWTEQDHLQRTPEQEEAFQRKREDYEWVKERLERRLKVEDNTYRIGDLYLRAGNSARDLGLEEEAREYAEKAVTIFRRLVDEEKSQDRQSSQSNSFLSNLTSSKRKLAEALSRLGSAKIRDPEEQIRFAEEALNIYQELGDQSREIEELKKIGNSYYMSGNFAQAKQFYGNALEIVRMEGDARSRAAKLQEANIMVQIAKLENLTGETRSALIHSQEALSIFQEFGDRYGGSNCLDIMGESYHDLGDLHTSLHCFQMRLKISRSLGDTDMISVSLSRIMSVYHNLGEFHKGLGIYTGASQEVKVARSNGKALLFAYAARLYRLVGDPKKALVLLEKSESIYQYFPSALSTVLADIGQVYFDLEDLSLGLEYQRKALAIASQLEFVFNQGVIKERIGLIYQDLGQLNEALQLHREVLEIHQHHGYRLREATALDHIGMCHRKLGDPEQALEYHRDALKIQREISHRPGEALALANIGLAYQSLDQPDRALSYLQRSLKLHQTMDRQLQIAKQLENIARLHHQTQDLPQALATLNQALDLPKIKNYPAALQRLQTLTQTWVENNGSSPG